MSNVLSKLCLEQALHVPAAAKFLEKNFKKTLTNKRQVGYYYLTERLVIREQTEFGSQPVGRRSAKSDVESSDWSYAQREHP